MRKFPGLVVVLAAACTLYSTPRLAPSPPGVDRRFSRAELVADVDQLFTTFEHVHPDLYAVTPKDSMDRARRAFAASVADSAWRHEIIPGLQRLVALIGDGHTSVGGGLDARTRYMRGGGRTFAIGVEVDQANALRVTGVIGPMRGIQRGERLVSVNGHDADSLLREFMLESSGETPWWRARVAAQSFGGLLWLHGIASPYSLRVAGIDGAVRSVDYPGLSQAEIDSMNARRAATTPAAPSVLAPASNTGFTYRLLDDRVAYINFFSMGGELGPFKKRVAETFGQIARDSARALVIDLRNNGGGNSALGEAMLAHFVDRPYRSAAAKVWRASDEYRAHMRAGLHAPLKWFRPELLHPQGRPLFRAPVGTNVVYSEEPSQHGRAEPRYTGPVCVLIGRGTFSSAMEIADGIKAYRLAPLLGEDTGGIPSSFGETYSFRLPRTGLIGTVSSALYLRASGDTTDHGPVRPDIVVHRSPEDLRLGRDPVLARARGCASLSY